ncbi:MAG: hypothetical protein ACOYN4_15080, partial [Bacteroidales bacterium]
HEIASLSWFFCVMTKEQKLKQNRNLSSGGNIAQHIKIIFCLCAAGVDCKSATAGSELSI